MDGAVLPLGPEAIRELDRLVDRVRGQSPAWFAGRGRAGAPSRAVRLQTLVAELAQWAQEAGDGSPLGVPPVLGNHALGDQIAVLTHDLLGAPGASALLPAVVARLRELQAAL